MKQGSFSPLMNQISRTLAERRIYLSRKKKLNNLDKAWNSGLAVECRGKVLCNGGKHPVSVCFGHREGHRIVEVFDLSDTLTILSIDPD